MITSKQKNKIYDVVQRAWVTACITVTLGSTAYVGYQLYNYFTKIKPIKQEMEERFREELLNEGRMQREQAQIN